jgi:UDP-3-O-[3-hydroxymyristoyl] glucosamine N-acyltransferase
MAAPIISKPVSLSEIHQVVGGVLQGDGTVELSALASLSEAEPAALSFVLNDRVLKGSVEIRAGALLAHRHIAELPIPHIVVPNPLLAFSQVAKKFFIRPYAARGIAPDVIQGENVRIGEDPSIWPFVTLGDGVTLGSRVTLYPGVFVGAGSTIGDDCLIYPNVVIREGSTIGNRVVIHGGTVIGSDGFGYVQHEGRHHKIPQLGGVTIEDDVELGANVSIDRATLGQTLIRQGTKVDNLVQIAHNVTIGEHAILVAQVGIAGSSTIGRHVMIGGQAGLADHIQVGDQVMIAARAGVNRNLESNQIVSGAPVMPHETWVKAQAVIPRLPELRQLVRSLETRVAFLEERAAKGGTARTQAKSSRKPARRTAR